MTMKAHLFSGSALAAALLLAAAPRPADAQTAQPQAQPGQGAAPSRAETPGQPAIPASDVDYTRSMERLFQAAQRLRESVQAMAQQPAGERRNQAMAQAREALLHTQQAMVSLPANLRTNQNYRDAEQRVGEAERALQGNQPDAQRAQGAADALLIVVPRLQADAGAAAGVPLQSVQSLVGTNVIGANGREAGEVENLLIDRSGQVRGAVVEWGGFLGIGERRAVVPINQLQVGAGNDNRARLEMTREQLEQLPRYERDRLAEYGSRYGWGEGLRLFR
jgi:sporulation protein YlmC with PRC-barrel domain